MHSATEIFRVYNRLKPVQAETTHLPYNFGCLLLPRENYRKRRIAVRFFEKETEQELCLFFVYTLSVVSPAGTEGTRGYEPRFMA